MLFADPLPALADAGLDYLPGWVDAAVADDWLAALVRETPWQQPELFIHGRYHRTPRLTAWYGEPEARYRLHDAIQQQLLQGPHYLVRYTLHTPQGALTLLEMGEPFKQRNRQLLRGYLLVADASLDQFAPAEQELHTQNQQLRSSLQQYQRTQNDHLQHLARSRTQQQLIVRLARQRYTSSDPQQEAAELITQAACEVYGVARAGIWKLGSHHLDSVSLYRRDLDRHEQLPSINARNFPQYLQALHSGRAIDAHDAQCDPRTCELTASYLQPLGICSMRAALRIAVMPVCHPPPAHWSKPMRRG